jgi:hypothetical protein
MYIWAHMVVVVKRMQADASAESVRQKSGIVWFN